VWSLLLYKKHKQIPTLERMMKRRGVEEDADDMGAAAPPRVRAVPTRTEETAQDVSRENLEQQPKLVEPIAIISMDETEENVKGSDSVSARQSPASKEYYLPSVAAFQKEEEADWEKNPSPSKPSARRRRFLEQLDDYSEEEDENTISDLRLRLLPQPYIIIRVPNHKKSDNASDDGAEKSSNKTSDSISDRAPNQKPDKKTDIGLYYTISDITSINETNHNAPHETANSTSNKETNHDEYQYLTSLVSDVFLTFTGIDFDELM
jgi:hypothetical protein